MLCELLYPPQDCDLLEGEVYVISVFMTLAVSK